MFANAANRYPHNTPTTKEGFRYRMIFEEIFPGEAAEKTVPGGKSIACSTERAMNWDASFALRADPSGRCAGVHDSAYDDNFVADTVLKSDEPEAKKAKTNQIRGVVLSDTTIYGTENFELWSDPLHAISSN